MCFKQTYPPDLHRSKLNLLQMMQNSKNVEVDAPRDKIIKKEIKLCAESIYYSIFKCVTNTTALLLGCKRIFFKQTYPPDLHRSNLNLLQVMQNSRNVKVDAPRDKIPWG